PVEECPPNQMTEPKAQGHLMRTETLVPKLRAVKPTAKRWLLTKRGGMQKPNVCFLKLHPVVTRGQHRPHSTKATPLAMVQGAKGLLRSTIPWPPGTRAELCRTKRRGTLLLATELWVN